MCIFYRCWATTFFTTRTINFNFSERRLLHLYLLVFVLFLLLFSIEFLFKLVYSLMYILCRCAATTFFHHRTNKNKISEIRLLHLIFSVLLLRILLFSMFFLLFSLSDLYIIGLLCEKPF